MKDSQRQFADLVLSGKDQTQAYMSVYKQKNPDTAAVSASKLVRNAKVKAYMDAQRAKAVDDTNIDLQWLIRESVATYRAAQRDGAHAASVSALKEVGVLTGQRVEKRQNENINRDASELSEEELEAIALHGSAGTAGAKKGAPGSSELH